MDEPRLTSQMKDDPGGREDVDHVGTYVLDETAFTRAMTIEELAQLAASEDKGAD